MRTLLFSLFLLVAPLAHAGWGETFSFNLDKGDAPGCVKVTYVTTSYDFPNLENGVVTSVRFFYSKKSHSDVTEDSPFQETRPEVDENGSQTVSPNEFCGLSPGRTYFKYGLYDADGNVLDFMADGDWSQYGNSVDVEEAP